MSDDPSRRNFLRLSALGIAASATAEMLPPQPVDAAQEPRGSVSVRVTYGDKRFAAAPSIVWRHAPAATAAATITLDPSKIYQQVLGFGAAFTDAACYMFNQLSAPAREQLFHEIFHPSEMGLNVCRTCIGSSDYATKVYSYTDVEDPELKNFSIEHDRAYILPMLRLARKINPDLFLFSSPWSPPGWMKANGSMLGGSMRRRHLGTYAKYFLKFLKAYEAEGVPVQAVSSQNEVDTDQDGRMPACIWPQEYEIEFVRDHLGPLLRKNGLNTQIWLVDHNYNLWGRAICELDEPELRKYANAIAWHGYVGGPEMMTKVHNAHPDAEMFWTEGGPDYTDPKYATDWCKWGETFAGILRNWSRCIIGWNLALDEKGRPNIGPFPCGGLVTIHSETKEVSRSGQFWATAHYARAIRRGARRFDSQSKASALHHVAFQNTDGEQVLVITNPGSERKAQIRSGSATAFLELPRDSVTTLTWR
jgi:glucosylceramidase